MSKLGDVDHEAYASLATKRSTRTALASICGSCFVANYRNILRDGPPVKDNPPLFLAGFVIFQKHKKPTSCGCRALANGDFCGNGAT